MERESKASLLKTDPEKATQSAITSMSVLLHPALAEYHESLRWHDRQLHILEYWMSIRLDTHALQRQQGRRNVHTHLGTPTTMMFCTGFARLPTMVERT